MKKKNDECCTRDSMCGSGMCGKICPLVFFLAALLWLLNDLGIFVTNLPWLPILAVLVTFKILVLKYMK